MVCVRPRDYSGGNQYLICQWELRECFAGERGSRLSIEEGGRVPQLLCRKRKYVLELMARFLISVLPFISHLMQNSRVILCKPEFPPEIGMTTLPVQREGLAPCPAQAIFISSGGKQAPNRDSGLCSGIKLRQGLACLGNWK